MYQMFMVSLREGLEAFLIVAISLAYLRKTGRGHLAPAVYWGIGVSVVASVLAGLAMREAANKPALGGIHGFGDRDARGDSDDSHVARR